MSSETPRPSNYLSANNYFAFEQPHGPTVLELRDSLTGHLLRVLLECKTNVGLNAARAADGSIVIATTKDCSSDVERLDARTGRLQKLRHVGEPIHGLWLSPKADRIAYMTYPACRPASANERNYPGGPTGFNPNVLAIIDLTNGKRVSAATPNPGNPFEQLSWSPDGTHVAAGYYGPFRQSIVILDAVNPSFSRARTINAPRRCGYISPAWISTGLIVGEFCGDNHFHSPEKLVRMNLSGRVFRTWPLPPCINGLGTLADASFNNLLVSMDMPYGGASPCQRSEDTVGAFRIAALSGDALQTLVNATLTRKKQDFGAPIGW